MAKFSIRTLRQTRPRTLIFAIVGVVAGLSLAVTALLFSALGEEIPPWLTSGILLVAAIWIVVLLLSSGRARGLRKARPYAFLGLIGLGAELALGATALVLFVLDEEIPPWLTSGILLIAVIWLLILLVSFVWEGKSPDGTKGRVAFAVVFGYLLVLLAVGSTLQATIQQQRTAVTGLTTSEVRVDDLFIVRLQAQSSVSLQLFEFRVIRLLLRATLDFPNASTQPLSGDANVGISRVDAPLIVLPRPVDSPWLVLNSTNRSGAFEVRVNPATGIRAGVYNISYFVQYDFVGPTVNTSGTQVGTISIGVGVGGLSKTWYLVFLFTGILTSFWWRIANNYLKPEDDQIDLAKKKQTWLIAYFLLVPIFSAIIALVVFSQLLPTLSLSADPFVNAISGFVYGFFWENATKKFGESVTHLYGRMRTPSPANAASGETEKK
jgi:hypothetical protein